MRILLIIGILLCAVHGHAQKPPTSKFLSFDDLANFWRAYDKVVESKDSSEQVKIIQTVYLNKASFELHFLLKVLNYSAADYLVYIRAYPWFWKIIRERSRFLMVNYQKIEAALRKLKTVYRPIQIPDVNFFVGCFDFGGRPFGDKVMIAMEVALSDGNLDISAFTDSSKASQEYSMDAVIYFTLHEIIHTVQPYFNAQDLLTLSVMEGSCDFITELVMEKPLKRPYIVLGNRFEKRIWDSFRKEMNGFLHDSWLYNKGYVVKGEEDLGYYIGYAICKYYYEQSGNRRRALRRIMNLNFTDNTDVYKFFLRSGYEKKMMLNAHS